MWLAFFVALLQGLAKALGIAVTVQERQAGAAQSQMDATNAEINRVQNSAHAGAATDKLPIDTPDPYDESK